MVAEILVFTEAIIFSPGSYCQTTSLYLPIRKYRTIQRELERLESF